MALKPVGSPDVGTSFAPEHAAGEFTERLVRLAAFDRDKFIGGLVMLTQRTGLSLFVATFLAMSCGIPVPAYGQGRQSRDDAAKDDSSKRSREAQREEDEPRTAAQRNQAAPDPAADAVAIQNVASKRPEQQITQHDRSPVFDITKPAPITMDLKNQPKAGRITGFDFARDPLNSDK